MRGLQQWCAGERPAVGVGSALPVGCMPIHQAGCQRDRGNPTAGACSRTRPLGCISGALAPSRGSRTVLSLVTTSHARRAPPCSESRRGFMPTRDRHPSEPSIPVRRGLLPERVPDSFGRTSSLDSFASSPRSRFYARERHAPPPWPLCAIADPARRREHSAA